MLQSNEELILSFNAVVMQDKAYRAVFGQAVNEDLRAVLRWIIGLQRKFGKVPTTELRDAVSEAIGMGASVARTSMHDVEERGYAGSKSGDLGNEFLWDLKPGAREKWIEVQQLCLRIADVVRAQLADPTNPTAGSQMLPTEVYYNVIADERFRREDIAAVRRRKKERKQAKQETTNEDTMHRPRADGFSYANQPANHEHR